MPTPADFSSAALWQRFCRFLYSNAELGLAVDVSRIPFDDAALEGLRPKFAKAFDAMAKLEAGAVANIDEQRMVGHYWVRDPETAPTPELAAGIRKNVADVKKLAADVLTGEIAGATGLFQNVLVVGIGGSALGPQFVAKALKQPNHPGLKPYFSDNTDPGGLEDVLAELEGELGRTIVVVISKSGGTPETRNGMLEVQAAYKRAGVPFARHFVAVTGVGSKLDKVAEGEGWLARFPMEDWVGGRTSVMSTVGLVPMALQGLDVDGFLAGAAAVDRATRVASLEKNPAALLAFAWYVATDGRGAKDMVLLP
ncbi:MAG: glucose-6-phosphate isomerase, partial [Planctomycetia bacterium]